MTGCSIVMTEMLLLLFRLLRVSLLSPRVFNGAPKIDLPLSMFSLPKSVLTLVFSISTLLVGGKKTVELVEAILGEEKSYPKPIRSKADF